MADKEREKRLRIACSCPPYSGHVNPLVSVAEALATRKGNEVHFLTFPYAIKKIKTRCDAIGIKTVGLSIPESLDSEEKLNEWVKPKLCFPSLVDHYMSSFEEALDAIDPDVVISDWACLASQKYAASRNIPLVINWPGPVEMVLKFLRFVINLHSNRFTFAAGGLFVSYLGFELGPFLLFNALDLLRFSDGLINSIACGNSMVLVHSFWGLERPHYLLNPNIIPIGPIEKVVTKTTDFSQSNPELDSFLQSARGSQRKVLFVSTGTLVQLEKWMVQLLWEAFEKVSREDKVSIVWSLMEAQQEFLSEKQIKHPSFHLSSWLPQPALLASDLVDGVFTHCGWGGTTECVMGGKPVAVLPFFGDQMINAKLLVQAGCATAVAPIPSFNADLTGRSSYAQPNNDDLEWLDLRERLRRFTKVKVTVECVVEGCQRILKDPRYMKKAKKLQALSTGPGKGRDFACDLIEHAGHHGLQHLTESGEEDDDLPRTGRHVRSLSGHRPLLVTLALGAMAGGALVQIYPLIQGLVGGTDL